MMNVNINCCLHKSHARSLVWRFMSSGEFFSWFKNLMKWGIIKIILFFKFNDMWLNVIVKSINICILRENRKTLYVWGSIGTTSYSKGLPKCGVSIRKDFRKDKQTSSGTNSWIYPVQYLQCFITNLLFPLQSCDTHFLHLVARKSSIKST